MTNFDRIPEELKARRQWVVWYKEERKGKSTKVLYNPYTGKRASSTDPATWAPFSDAVQAFTSEGSQWNGIGYVFAPDDPYTGIDLDEITPWGNAWVEQLASYTERSQSGRGLHVIVRAKLPPGRRRKGKAEMYDGGRFFVMTGDHVDGTPLTIEDRQAEVDALHAELFEAAPQPVPVAAGQRPEPVALTLDDEAVIEKASRAKNGDAFRDLFTGKHGYSSPSEADAAFLRMLRFYCAGDEAQMDRIFRRSGLYRDKWEREDYREKTFALSRDQAEFYTGRREDAPPAALTIGGDGRALPASGEERGPFNLTDVGNAERLVSEYRGSIRYCHPQARWYIDDGRRWVEDVTAEIERRAIDTVRGIYAEAAACSSDDRRRELGKHAMKSESTSRIKAMIEAASWLPGVPVKPEDLDVNPWLLNVENGTLDLRTGILQPHDPEDLITKLAPVVYDPCATAPTWYAVLDRIMGGNERLTGYLQRLVGYTLTGLTIEQVMAILYGIGANGKSTFVETIAAMLGDYAQQTPTETLTVKKNDGGVPNDLARLRGARFVSAVEAGEGARLAENLVKQMTGGDRLTARFLRQEFFEFTPAFKLYLATNHKPVIRGTDNGIWRRIHLVPFSVAIPEPEQDKNLPEKLKAELPGILNWALEGCLEWQRVGLQPPPEVLAATQEYRDEMDTLAAFIEECCVLDQFARAKSSDLYGAYRLWCERSGERASTQKAFSQRLAERGFTSTRIKGPVYWRGIGILTEQPEDGV